MGHLYCDDDYQSIQSATFGSHVWSPYAIPHAIALEHCYHERARSTTFEFHCIWSYKLLDFEPNDVGGIHRNDNDEDDDDDDDDFEQVCSCCFEDEELRAYEIETPGLNDSCLLTRLRRFLFGSSSDASKQETGCTDYQFWLLLFASMGTLDYDTLWTTEGIGWVWSPRIYYMHNNSIKDKELLEPMIQSKLLHPGHPGESDACDIQVSWLEYQLRKVSNTLRPADQYYRPPPRQDAIGYYLKKK
jgi:hypothetical protein